MLMKNLNQQSKFQPKESTFKIMDNSDISNPYEKDFNDNGKSNISVSQKKFTNENNSGTPQGDDNNLSPHYNFQPGQNLNNYAEHYDQGQFNPHNANNLGGYNQQNVNTYTNDFEQENVDDLFPKTNKSVFGQDFPESKK